MSEENTMIGFFEGTILENGYGYISREVMRNPSISKGAKVVYCYLLSFAGDRFNAFPKVATVCHELGFGNQGTYYKYLNELKEHGLLYTKLIKDEKGKWSKNVFYLTRNKNDIEKIKEMNETVDNAEEKPYFKNRSTENRSTENRSTNINSLNINNLNIEEEEAFQQICNSYSFVKNKDVTLYDRKILLELFKTFKGQIILLAIETMVERADKPNLSYLKKTLEDWKAKGLDTIEKIELHFAKEEILKEDAKKNKHQKLENAAKGNTRVKKDSFNSYDQREMTAEQLEEIAKATRGNEEVKEITDTKEWLERMRNKKEK